MKFLIVIISLFISSSCFSQELPKPVLEFLLEQRFENKKRGEIIENLDSINNHLKSRINLKNLKIKSYKEDSINYVSLIENQKILISKEQDYSKKLEQAYKKSRTLNKIFGSTTIGVVLLIIVILI